MCRIDTDLQQVSNLLISLELAGSVPGANPRLREMRFRYLEVSFLPARSDFQAEHSAALRGRGSDSR